MPIYNTQEEHLRAAVESVLSQTFKDFEFLILNDSPNNSRLDEIVTSYHDSRIRYSRNEQNMGITPSRNKLLNMAQGEYISIFDHDDLCEPTRLEKQVAYLDTHPATGVVGCNARIFPSGKIVTYPEDDLSIKEFLMDVCPLLHPACMLRKSVLDTHGIQYEEEYTPSEDYRLWLRLMEFTNFHNLQEVLFNYRMHETNTSKVMHTRMRQATDRLHSWARFKYPHHWHSYRSEKPYEHVWKLFGCIPFLSIWRHKNKLKVKLFGICILTRRKKEGTHPQSFTSGGGN